MLLNRRPSHSPTYLGGALELVRMSEPEQLQYEDVSKDRTESVPKHCVVLLRCTALANLLLHCASFLPLGNTNL